MSKRTIRAQSGHTIFVKSISKNEIPGGIDISKYDQFYVVKNFDDTGCVFMYLGKGYKEAPKEIVAWYRNTGSMWSGYGNTIKEAIDGAQKDGWLYA